MKFPFVLLFLCSNILYSFPIINEVFPAPYNNEPEWAELYNPQNEPISGTFIIEDAAGGKTEFQLNIPEKAFCIITKDSAMLKNYRGKENTIFIQTKLPGLNNTTDYILLKSADNTLIDSFYYDIKWGKKGFSFERINPTLSAEQENISISASPDSATCGYINSVSKADRDISVSPLQSNNKGEYLFSIANIGNYSVENIEINFSIVSVSNTVTQIPTQRINCLKCNESHICTLNQIDLMNETGEKGDFILRAILTIDDDKNENNSAEMQIYLPFNENTVLFNEVLFDADSTCGEFIELYNNSRYRLNLKNWTLLNYTNDKADSIILTKNDFYFEPESFLILLSDSNLFNSFPELIDELQILFLERSLVINNTEDKFKLLQKDFSTIDSFQFSAKQIPTTIFPKKNRSLEKTSKFLPSDEYSNWQPSLSIKLSTPLRENSIVNEVQPEAKISFSRNPIPKSILNGLQITVSSPFKRAYLVGKVFDLEGNLISEPMNLTTVGAKTELGTSFINELSSGAYILVFEITDIESGENKTLKELFVVSEQ